MPALAPWSCWGRRVCCATGAIRSAARRRRIGLSIGSTVFVKASLAGGEEPAEPPTTVCPSCGAILAADQKTCPDCGAIKNRPAVGSLYRLLAFAKPRTVDDSAGVRADVGGNQRRAGLPVHRETAGRQCPETGDDTSRQPGPSIRCGWYLLAFAGAAVLAWLLTWGRTYVLAWVSERIAADLRNQTYAHMQTLSLEFFGGKRTGDLISRREQRHRSDLLFSFGLRAGFCQRRLDDSC